MSDEEGMECAATYREIFLENKQTMIVKPFPHVIETLRELHHRGFVLGMASSRNHCSLDGYVKQMQLEDIFSSIVAGDDVENAKPAPDMVFKALKEMKGTADETLVVGDMTFDVDMAHHAGCKACAVTYGNGQSRCCKRLIAASTMVTDIFSGRPLAMSFASFYVYIE